MTHNPEVSASESGLSAQNYGVVYKFTYLLTYCLQFLNHSTLILVLTK